nr:hypothetical protein [Tanacetum cinerariifolium]
MKLQEEGKTDQAKKDLGELLLSVVVELFDYQYNMGLLLIENKELTANLRNLDKHYNLRKALDFEKRCRDDEPIPSPGGPVQLEKLQIEQAAHKWSSHLPSKPLAHSVSMDRYCSISRNKSPTADNGRQESREWIQIW